jgi:deoxyribose-phosphate aldolase
MGINIKNIIEHTNYKPNSTRTDIKKLCREAISYSFRTVCVNLSWVKFANQQLRQSSRGRKVKLSAIIDFPLGASGLESKINQAKIAQRDGADEIDTVIYLGNFFEHRYKLVDKEVRSVNSILPSKFIVEHSLLNNKQIIKLAEIIYRNNATLKLASGFIPSDLKEKIRHIKLIKKHFPDLRIKASGGIKTAEEVNKLVKAGAAVIGTSCAVEIMKKSRIMNL